MVPGTERIKTNQKPVIAKNVVPPLPSGAVPVKRGFQSQELEVTLLFITLKAWAECFQKLNT